MEEALRPDGKPFVADGRGAYPKFVIEDDSAGDAVITAQFLGIAEYIGPWPLDDDSVKRARKRLMRRVREVGHFAPKLGVENDQYRPTTANTDPKRGQ